MPTRLHAETPVMHKKDEVCPLSVPPFTKLELGFMSRRFRMISVEAEFHSHPTGLNKIRNLISSRLISSGALTYPIYIHVRFDRIQLEQV